jgi:hypothetical protein
MHGQIALWILILLFTFSKFLTAQSSASSTGSITGVFQTPNGHPLHGYLQLAGNAPGPVSRKVLAFATDGSFQFASLPAGIYSICARSTPDQAPSLEEPFLDSCAWPAFAQTVRLKSGQALTGLKVQGQPGVKLHVRINDPLQALVALVNPYAVDPNLELHVRGADQFAHIIPKISSDAAGRDHELVVPHDTYLILRSRSKTLSIADATGKLVAPEQQVFVKSGTLPAQITLQVSKLP